MAAERCGFIPTFQIPSQHHDTKIKVLLPLIGPISNRSPYKVLDKIIARVPIGRLVEPEEVAALVAELYRNEALAGDVFYIHGGLRLGSQG